MRTQVGIIGAGPAGLMLAHLLHLEGIESIVIESHTRQYIEERVRAGVLEQGTVEMMTAMGVGDRLKREGLTHEGVEFCFQNQRRRVDFLEMAGRTITVYAQHEVIKDLVAARISTGRPLLFEAEGIAIEDNRIHPPRNPLHARRRSPNNRMRFRRRLRWLPRCVPSRHAAGQPAPVRTNLPVRMARNSGCGRPVQS